jgi:hypothetical protein
MIEAPRWGPSRRWIVGPLLAGLACAHASPLAGSETKFPTRCRDQAWPAPRPLPLAATLWRPSLDCLKAAIRKRLADGLFKEQFPSEKRSPLENAMYFRRPISEHAEERLFVAVAATERARLEDDFAEENVAVWIDYGQFEDTFEDSAFLIICRYDGTPNPFSSDFIADTAAVPTDLHLCDPILELSWLDPPHLGPPSTLNTSLLSNWAQLRRVVVYANGEVLVSYGPRNWSERRHCSDVSLTHIEEMARQIYVDPNRGQERKEHRSNAPRSYYLRLRSRLGDAEQPPVVGGLVEVGAGSTQANDALKRLLVHVRSCAPVPVDLPTAR